MSATISAWAGEPCEVLRSEPNPLNKNETWIGDALSLAAAAFLGDRCWFELGVRESLACNRAALALVKTLDCDSSSLFPCFVGELNEILKSPRVGEYLRGLTEAAQSAVEHGEPFNLWNWTLSFMDGDRKKAILWIAALFQEEGNQLSQYLGRLSTDPGRLPLSALIRASGTLTTLQQKRPDLVSFFPEEIKGVGTGLYHFYIPAYLSLQMAESKDIEKKLASGMPFLFNASYELTAHVNPTSSIPGGKLAMYMTQVKRFAIPDHFEPKGNQHAINATYLGLQGALWGSGAKAQPPTLERFRADFSSNPREEIRRRIEAED